jgi:hypothetical protein
VVKEPRTGGGSWTGGRSNSFFTTHITPKYTPWFFVRLKVEQLS